MSKAKTKKSPKTTQDAEIENLKEIVGDIANREMIEVDKQVVTDLASCVLWALKFLKTPNGTGMHFDSKTMTSTPWQEKFMLALDGVGYVINRKDFWKQKAAKKAKGRRP